MKTTIVEQIIRLVPAVAAMAVFTVFTVLKIMKDYAPFMFTPLVIMLALSVGIDQSSYGASAEEGDDVTHVYVSGGSMSEPYFEFYADSEGTTEISELDITNTYTFHRLNGATSHPFYISDSGYEQESSAKITLTGDGSSNSGIAGSETFTISFEDGFTVDDTLSYYCTVHSNMIGEFTLTETVTLPNIPATAVSTGEHTSLVAALAHANLVGVLSGDGPYTVFAPTDSAFEEMGLNLSGFDTDEENATLAKILSYHVTMGSVMSSDLSDGMEVNTLIQEPITVNFYGEDTVVLNGDATVTSANVETSNGIIHIIDKVLMPPSLTTVTPPVGEICYDMDTHAVDLSKTEETCDEMWIPSVDIPTTAAATTIHTSLVAALEKANLTTTLKGEGPFTVFAPTDEAFTAAGINLDDYDTDEKISALADILLMHVVSGKVMSSNLTDGMEATALSGDVLTFTVGSTVSANDAVVTIDEAHYTISGSVHKSMSIFTGSIFTGSISSGSIVSGDMSEHQLAVKIERDYHHLRLTTASYQLRARLLPAIAQNVIEYMPEQSALSGLLKVSAPMPGLLTKLLVSEGDTLFSGQEVAIMEAMKMENSLRCEIDCVVGVIHASEGDLLNVDDLIITLKEK